MCPMTKDFGTQERYVCEECGFDTVVVNERCPNCNALMSALHEQPKAKPSSETDDEELKDDTFDVGGSVSLQEEAEKEQDESDREYRSDTFGDDE